LVVSADALRRLADADQYALEDLGARSLRGRSDPVQIYAVAGPAV
jgi:class 3 adenylate cyclase